MAEQSKIEWTHATFNPWIGCTKLSAACDNCYAETERAVTCLGVTWGAGQQRHRTAASTWKQPLAWNRKAAKEGRRMRVFCASLADVFDAEVPEEWRTDLFALIDQTPNLDWLLLTKRPAVARKVMPATPRPNVWLGTTVENQAMAEARIPHLLATPAAVRFLSMEPLLGAVSLRRWLPHGDIGYDETGAFLDYVIPDPGLDWVIAGGESGPGARPSHPDWFRSVRDQCAAADAPFLFKQWGEWATSCASLSTGHAVFRQFSDYQQWVNKAPTWVNGGICLDVDGKRLGVGADFMAARDAGKFPVTIMHRVGKKAAGRHLDGVLHDGYPVGRAS